jgi:class 3 adenylate cyclase/CHASE2 domain-containing sensor protein
MPRRIQRAMMYLLVALALVWLVPYQRLNLAWFDVESRLQQRWAPTIPDPVVLVAFDEATVSAFPEPVALWHDHLGQVLQGLAAGGPRVVGLDLNLPDRSFDRHQAGLDAALLRGLILLKRRCPVVLGVTVEGSGIPRSIHAPFRQVVGQDGLGLVQWEFDDDGVVRRFSEHLQGNADATPTLSGQMARAMGRPVRSGWLDYRGAQRLPYVPLHQVEAWQREGRVDELRAAFAGKAVLLGAVLPFEDRHRQPVDITGWGEANHGNAPGVMLHVQALRNHLGRGPLRPVPAGWVIGLGVVLLGGGWLAGGHPRWIALTTTSVLAGILGSSFLLHSAGALLLPAIPALGWVAGAGGRLALLTSDRLMERRRLRGTFGGYVSPGVLKEILAGRISPNLNGQRASVCVLFTDIRGYTTISERLEPEGAVALLNRFWDRISPAIHHHGGTVDSYMGDGMMAHFGDPQALANPCRSAFDAALEMLEALEGLNRDLVAEGGVPMRIGIGLHSGEAVVGHIGSSDRHAYTAIGDTVNVASRVEGMTKSLGYPLLVTAAVAERLGEGCGLQPLGAFPLRGRSAMELFGWSPGSTRGEVTQGEPPSRAG